jgi:hypothetical protein
VRVIDDWHTARSLGLVIEARVGSGRLIVCGFELDGPAASDPVSRQLRRSLVAYAASPRFTPRTALSEEMVKALVA